MAIKFGTTGDVGDSINILIYGDAGVGKTSLIATSKKPYIISTESGLLSIKKHDLPYAAIENLDDLYDLYEMMEENKKKYKTLCLDSISDIAETCLIALKKTNKDGRAAYGQLNVDIAEAIKKFRDLPISTYFIAKSEMYENASGLQATRASMPGKKLVNDLDFFFDEVLYLSINNDDEDNTYRQLQCHPSATVAAKDRSGNLNKIEKPDLKHIFKKLKG